MMLINVKMQTIFGILTYNSMINTTSERLKARNFFFLPGRVAQSVTFLATDACLTADPGVASSIPAVTIQNGWNNRISYGCVYAPIRSGLGMHLVTFSNHDTVLFLLIVPIKGRFV